MGWVTPYHPTTAELSACVECGLCLPHCPTYRLTGRDTASPRGRLMAMSAVASGQLDVDESFADIMGFCLQCRACEAVCPSLVPFGRAMEGARAEVTAQSPDALAPARRWALGRFLASPGAMKLATAGVRFARAVGLDRVLPKTLARPMSGIRPLEGRGDRRGRSFGRPELGTIGLLAGCVMEPWFAGVQGAAIDLLVRGGYRVVVPADQACCGALAAHDGAADEAARLAHRNVLAFGEVDLVVATAAGCSAHLRDYGHWADEGHGLASRARDVTVVVAELIQQGRLPTLAGGRGTVAVQDPCHLRHAQRETAGSRVIARAAGYEPVDVDPGGMCCGAAGIYSLRHPDTSARLGTAKADEVRATGSTVVVSANPGCEMQLRSHLDPWFRVLHPIELYAEALA